jgi:superoxide reductase
MVAAGPAGALLLPLFSPTGQGTLAADVESCADTLGKLPDNVIYTEARQGVWEGKAGGHLPIVDAKKSGGKIALTVKTEHGMSQAHYIVRHSIVNGLGEVLGAKTFSWEDEPESTYEIELPTGSDKSKQLFVTSYCNLHDLWLAQTKLEV